jgi:hypothetical protein
MESTSQFSVWAKTIAISALALAAGVAGVLLFEAMSTTDQHIWLVVLVYATVSSIAGFAFSALASASLIHLASNPIYMVQIMLIASTAIQVYGVWALRKDIRVQPLLPFFAGGIVTVVPGVLLLITVNVIVYVAVLGAILVAYSVLILARPGFRCLSDSLPMRVLVGGLGGLPGCRHYHVVQRPGLEQATAARRLPTVHSRYASHRLGRAGHAPAATSLATRCTEVRTSSGRWRVLRLVYLRAFEHGAIQPCRCRVLACLGAGSAGAGFLTV